MSNTPIPQKLIVENIKECGEISAFDKEWDKASTKKPKTVKQYNGATFETSIYDDKVMIELIEKDAADVYTTDSIAALLMNSTKSNYSWDVEIKKFQGKIFIDKRHEEEDDDNKHGEYFNILDYDTVCETALDHQPMDDNTINGIRPLMKEAKKINNAFLNQCLSADPTKQIQLNDENPFIENEDQVCTRIGYVYKIWKY